MYVEDLRAGFFDVLRGVTSARIGDFGPKKPTVGRVLILVHDDVDALCAARILAELLRCDQVSHSLTPVAGRSDLIRAFREAAEAADEGGEGEQALRYVVLLNCGGTVDLVQDLALDDDEDPLYEKTLSKLVLFVADSHRPVDVCNVYNDGQIRLLMKQDAEENIPEYDKIFKDDDEEEEEEDADGRRRLDEQTILRRRERRLWEEERGRILFDYQQFFYYGEATALQMYELALKLTRGCHELLWLAVVGSAEQRLFDKADDQRALLETDRLRDHVSMLNNQVASTAVNSMRITFDNDLTLALYRHWTLLESLRCSVYTAARFRVWTPGGRQRLSEFLAELGLPLAQCRQRYDAMDLSLKEQIVNIFLGKADKYNLDSLGRGSFLVSMGYRAKYSADDAARAAAAILSKVRVPKAGDGDVDDDRQHAFLRALDALSARAGHLGALEEGVSEARELLEEITAQVQTFFDLRSVVSAGPFLYALIQSGAPNAKLFSRPSALRALASAALQAHVASHRRAANLPLILSAPSSSDADTCLVAGVPPATDRSRKNLLGKAFEQALKRTGCRFRLDCFDTSVFEMRTEDRAKFIDALVGLLT